MRVISAFVALLLVAAPLLPARSDEAPDGAESVRRVVVLRERIRRWVEARELPAVSNCRLCGGTGTRQRIDRDARGNPIGTHGETCQQCKGKGLFLDLARARNADWEFRSPAYRAIPSNYAKFQSVIDAWLSRQVPEPVLGRYRIGEVRLSGDRFGTVELFEDGATIPRDTRWVWVSLPGKPGNWFLYSEDVDGIWDGTVRESPPPTPAPPPAPPVASTTNRASPAAGARVVDGPEMVSLAGALAKHSVRAEIHSGERTSSRLLIHVRYAGVTDESSLRSAIRADIIPAMQALMSGDSAPSISVEFLTCYRDKLGEVTLRPYETVRIDRPTFLKIHFENLTIEEALQLFERESASYVSEDVILWWKGTCGVAGSAAAPLSLPPPRTPAPATSTSIANALQWLALHQSPDGGWECEGWPKWFDRKASPKNAELDGRGKAHYDVGVTGLALLAFLRAGYASRSEGPFGRVVARGLDYLRGVQDSEGCFGRRSTGHYVYNHAAAALAMIEAFGRPGGSVYKDAAQKAIDFIGIMRNPSFAWRYGVQPGDNDTSVTGWMLMALASASSINAAEVGAGRAAPLTYDRSAFSGIKDWIDKMTDPATGRVGYQQRGTGPARTSELQDQFPSEKSEAMTAVGILARIFLGESPKTSLLISRGVTLCAMLPPVWNLQDGSIDMYYWHYATIALRQVGGSTWMDWKSRMSFVAESNQRNDTEFAEYKGSWDNVDPWGADGGRVYSTAMMAICLQAASE